MSPVHQMQDTHMTQMREKRVICFDSVCKTAQGNNKTY